MLKHAMKALFGVPQCKWMVHNCVSVWYASTFKFTSQQKCFYLRRFCLLLCRFTLNTPPKFSMCKGL